MSLPERKISALTSLIKKFIILKSCVIRELAELIEKLVSICPMVQYGFLYLKLLERVKYLALKKSYGNYNKLMTIPDIVNSHLRWWLTSIPSAFNSISLPTFQLDNFSDASLTGWGVYCQGVSSRGYWSETEKLWPINYLELKAAFFLLKVFCL